MKRVILLSVVILLISLGYAFAEVPCKINYQERLIKDNVPVDGTKTMRFSIYDSAVGGNELWTSGDVSIEVHNGLFRYVIGSDGGDLSSIDWTAGQELYLEVKVETDILTPREEIYAYPYAINSHLLEGEAKEYFLNTSAEAQTKQGNLSIMGNVGIGTTKAGITQLHVYSASGQHSLVTAERGSNLLDAAFLSYPSGFISSTNVIWNAGLYNNRNNYDIWSWDGSTRRTRLTIRNNGNVGIGTTSPGAKLDVQGGAIKATGGLIIETRTSDPASPATGQTWLRSDIP